MISLCRRLHCSWENETQEDSFIAAPAVVWGQHGGPSDSLPALPEARTFAAKPKSYAQNKPGFFFSFHQNLHGLEVRKGREINGLWPLHLGWPHRQQRKRGKKSRLVAMFFSFFNTSSSIRCPFSLSRASWKERQKRKTLCFWQPGCMSRRHKNSFNNQPIHSNLRVCIVKTVHGPLFGFLDFGRTDISYSILGDHVGQGGAASLRLLRHRGRRLIRSVEKHDRGRAWWLGIRRYRELFSLWQVSSNPSRSWTHVPPSQILTETIRTPQVVRTDYSEQDTEMAAAPLGACVRSMSALFYPSLCG